jgi:hypothetical protein
MQRKEELCISLEMCQLVDLGKSWSSPVLILTANDYPTSSIKEKCQARHHDINSTYPTRHPPPNPGQSPFPYVPLNLSQLDLAYKQAYKPFGDTKTSLTQDDIDALGPSTRSPERLKAALQAQGKFTSKNKRDCADW